MRLSRPSGSGAFIPLTPLVDVMLILLVFFMVTSSFLDLDMIPMAGKAEEEAAADAPAPAAAGTEGRGGTMLIRLRADGLAQYRGQALDPPALGALIAARLAQAPATRVVILPSGAATAQALVSVTEAATRAGAADLGILRLEGGS